MITKLDWQNDAVWSPFDEIESGGTVYRLHGKARAPDLFLKHGSDAVADDVTVEMVRLS